VESARRRSAAEAAAADAERRLAALRLRAESDGARYRHDRDAFEAALIAAALADRRGDREAVRAGLFARALAPDLNRRMHASADALDEAVQSSLSRDAAEAERRARRFAAEARNLRELAQRVAAGRRRGNGSGSGADIVPAAWLAPAAGRISREFGERVAEGPAAQGVALRTRAGAQVVAPANGEVAYAGLFRSYGEVLILDLDGGYALVLAGLGATRVRAGERVQAGQPIGEMSVSDTAAPELYVEVRRDGRPINPARWLGSRGVAAEHVAGGPG
jgi:murein DD-endopeptidase MepM/ murein hydrolase activator NlpD